MPIDPLDNLQQPNFFLATSCLPTIVGKPADRCRQVCSQLSTGLLTVVDR
jgi:hypothetical protein